MTVVALPPQPLAPAHSQYLAAALPPGLDPLELGIRSAPEGIVFPWPASGGAVVPQLRPDVPRLDRRGKPVKYEFAKGAKVPVSCMRDDDGQGPVLIVEGTKQRYWALAYAPPEWAVYAVAGSNMWRGQPLGWAEGRTVAILFDGDVSSNRDVHDAARALHEALEAEGAEAVVHVRSSAQGKDGIDDVLAAMPEDRRYRSFARWLGQAKPSPGKPPAHGKSNRFLGKDGLMARELASDILAHQPAALTAEHTIALYEKGVYRSHEELALLSAVEERLADQHRPGHLVTAKQALQAQLHRSGAVLLERMPAPLANFANVMVDLRTGAVSPHDPAHFSRVQHPVEWDETAQCPEYERWLMEVIPQQWEDLEEVAGSMLDPSRTPPKAIFAFGPSHSGKSTFLRLLAAVAGVENRSAVTLHQLADDRFAAANVYGKCLNVAADLSNKDVSDMSTFKMLTGEDPIQANRKYGRQFTFLNTALFAFSANELPAVSESSRAYLNRIKPFHFPVSFEGREDPAREDRIQAELPGIVRRWAQAYSRRLARGSELPTLPSVAAHFSQASDRVRQWVATQTKIQPTSVGVQPTSGPDLAVESGLGSSNAELYAQFQLWVRSQGGKDMGRNKFLERMRAIEGVRQVRVMPTRARGLNVVMLAEGDRE